jgi:hypothetical protein
MPPMYTAVFAGSVGSTSASGWPRTGEPYRDVHRRAISSRINADVHAQRGDERDRGDLDCGGHNSKEAGVMVTSALSHKICSNHWSLGSPRTMKSPSPRSSGPLII